MPMRRAHMVLDPAFRVGDVDRRLFGTFVEHMGRSVYTGIYEPDHPTANAEGFRGDVLDLTRELGATVVRYPGGNFVSGYRWEDGVGPLAERPRRIDLAWRSIESNEVGLNEFAGWAREAGLELMLAVNLGTRGILAACDLLEYTNVAGGTQLSDLRISHGVKEPHDVRLWCLGNELDGPWQLGHTTADEYGRLAAEAAKAMRRLDPDIELVACGSSNSRMPTFGTWEATVLDHTYEAVDYISLHAYYEERSGDRASFLAAGVDMDRFISSVVATADHVGAKRRSRKRINISFDEWNVWYQHDGAGNTDPALRESPRLQEDTFTVTDAVVVSGLLITLLRHADRVTIACQAQLANVIGLIRTEPRGPAWRTAIFHPFASTARLARGTVLRAEPTGARHETAQFGEIDTVDSAATWDAESGALAVFVVNRHPDEPVALEVELAAFPGATSAEVLAIHDDDQRAANTASEPERVSSRRSTAAIVDGRLKLVLPRASWHAISIAAQPH
jgi:alpha-N-arabinofuranosidase